MLQNIVISVATIVFLVFDYASGCQPMRIHYQTTYCESDVVGIVHINGEYKQSEWWPFQLAFQGTIIDILKGNQLRVGSKVIIRTAGPSNSCGEMVLGAGYKFLIQGDIQRNTIVARVFNGALVIPNKAIEQRFRRRIALYEADRCRCKVETLMFRMPGSRPKPDECATTWNECVWNTGSCRSVNGVCRWVSRCRLAPQ